MTDLVGYTIMSRHVTQTAFIRHAILLPKRETSIIYLTLFSGRTLDNCYLYDQHVDNRRL
jgi:hypothetical protein